MLKKLVNIGVAVKDIEEAIARYKENFGAEVVRPIETNPGLNIQLAVVRVGDAEIEFFSPLPGEGALTKFLETRGEGLYRLAFESDSFETDLTQLSEKGVRSSVVQGDYGIAFLSPKAANGVMFELVEEHA